MTQHRCIIFKIIIWTIYIIYLWDFFVYFLYLNWLLYWYYKINVEYHLKNLSNTIQNILINWRSDKKRICAVRPIIESKLLYYIIFYLYYMLNITSILDSYLHWIVPSIPSTISPIIRPLWELRLFFIMYWLFYALAD